MTRSVAELEAAGLLKVEDGNHGEYRPRPGEFTTEGVVYVRAADVNSGRVDFEAAAKISPNAVARIRKGIGRDLDVLISHKGTVGRVALVPEGSPPFVCSPQTTFWRSRDHRVLDPRYLRSFLQCDFFVHQLDTLKASTDMAPYVSLTQQRAMIVRVPPPAEQRAIAEVMGALDDKIAANTRLATTADALARLDFARALDLPGIEAIAVGQCATTVLGGTPSRDELSYWTGGTVGWLNSGKANEARILEPSEWITEEALSKSTAKVMPQRATVVAITGATLGQVARLEITASGNQSLIGIWSDEPAMNDWIYFAIQHEIPQLLRAATGAAQQHVNKRDLDALVLPILDGVELATWGERVRPLLDLAAARERESLTLATTRDALLPALMSGKLRVRDAERVVEEVV